MQRILLFLFCISILQVSRAQNVCGVINTYYSVSTIDTCNNKLTINAKGLVKGDRVVIMQMNGATANLTNTNTFGSISSVNGAGNYEFNVVSDVLTDTVITFSLKFLNNYDPTQAVQIIQFPAFRSVNTTCLLTCKPWNGKTGGVLVLYATDTIRVLSKIDVSGKGFRGSNPINAGNCQGVPYSNYFTTTTSNLAARKGGGIVSFSSAYECGRGKAGNGGGGGNEHNSGGGGGANYGTGGDGGERVKNLLSCPGNFPGIGGESLAPYYNNLLKNKIFMGASGGCGHENNNYSGVSGSGGGIAFIVGRIIKCVNDTIFANGESVTAACLEDGGSGGGAGGTIIMKTDSVYGKIMLSVKGGNGQSVDNSGKNECYGPGGGGGGGVATISSKFKVTNVLFDTLGGKAGLVFNSTGPCNNTSSNAANGVAGHTFRNYIYNENPVIFRTFQVSLGADQTICKGDSAQLNANMGQVFEWTPSTGLSNDKIRNPKASPDTTTTYILKAFDLCNYSYDTVTVNVLPLPALVHTSDTSICYGDTLQLFATGGTTYAWSPPVAISSLTADNPKVWPSTDAKYIIKATTNGCVKIDTIHITVVQQPNLKIGKDTTVCIDDSMQLHVTGATRYVWSPNVNISDTTIADPRIKVSKDITYFVTGYNANGCFASTKINVSVRQCIFPDTLFTEITIPNVFTPNNDGENDNFELFVKNVTNFSIVIYNRWGEMIFSSNDMHFKWSGDNLPDGVYYFKINYTDSKKKAQQNRGPVTLIR